MTKSWHILVASACLALLQLATAEVIMGSNVRLALKTRAEVESSLRWCYVFFQEDFPDDDICESKDDEFWNYFPKCCNGAYKCKDGTIWRTFLCPPDSVYDDVADDCVPFAGDVCPYRGEDSPGEPSDPTTPEEPEEPVDCGSLNNGRLPHPSDCAKYIDCRNKEVCDCVEEYIYYHPFRVCLPGDRKTCTLYKVEDHKAQHWGI